MTCEPNASRRGAGPPGPERTRVIVAEDFRGLREGVVQLLGDAGFDVVASYGDADALLDGVRSAAPDLVVVDVRMPPTYTDEGLQAARAIRVERPNVAVLILSQYVEPALAVPLLELGLEGVGYLAKERLADTSGFVDVARRVAGGGLALDPGLVAQFIALRRHDPALAGLGAMERGLLGLMAEGLTAASIVDRMGAGAARTQRLTASLFEGLGLPLGDDAASRRRAVLAFLHAGPR